MPRHLPPLNALVALEATLRRQSIRRAAEELGVTAAAVSQHIKNLEEQYGIALLARHARGVSLTQGAKTLLPGLTRAFDEVEIAARPLVKKGQVARVTLSLLPALARCWLVPRLALLQRSAPHLELTVRAEAHFVDFERDEVDLAIRYCPAPPSHLHTVRLFGEEIFPVCSPALLHRVGLPAGADDLTRFPLLHDVDAEPHQPHIGWSRWFEEVGLSMPPGPHLHCNDSSTLLEAAVQGLGLALGRTPLASELLRRGALVCPWPAKKVSDRSYFLVGPRRAFRRPAVQLLAEWLTAQAQGT
jgi:LysR family glycine cleavage system transcriptional activator